MLTAGEVEWIDTMARMYSAFPSRKILASAAAAALGTLGLTLSGLIATSVPGPGGLGTWLPALLVGGLTLATGYLVPPAASDCLDRNRHRAPAWRLPVFLSAS